MSKYSTLLGTPLCLQMRNGRRHCMALKSITRRLNVIVFNHFHQQIISSHIISVSEHKFLFMWLTDLHKLNQRAYKTSFQLLNEVYVKRAKAGMQIASNFGKIEGNDVLSASCTFLGSIKLHLTSFSQLAVISVLGW